MPLKLGPNKLAYEIKLMWNCFAFVYYFLCQDPSFQIQDKATVNRPQSQALWQVQTRDYRKNQLFLEWAKEMREMFESDKRNSTTAARSLPDIPSGSTDVVHFLHPHPASCSLLSSGCQSCNEGLNQNALNRTCVRRWH